MMAVIGLILIVASFSMPIYHNFVVRDELGYLGRCHYRTPPGSFMT
jgi:hypothetical protein